jgi:tetratricopeptide (TPR) repeat protein
MPVFKGLPSSIASQPDLAIATDDQPTTAIWQMLADHDKIGARSAMKALIEMSEPTDPRKGWGYTQLGILDISEGKYKSAVEALRNAAEARVAVTRVDQVKAMRRIAWIYHTIGERAHAYKAYDELERYSGSDYMKAICRVEKCGILMEYARSEKGTLAECRQAFELALSQIPQEDARERGTIELMNLESYFYEGNYAEALRLGDAWLTSYDAQLRDKYMVLQFMATASDRTGDLERSKTLAAQILELPEPTDPWDQFGSGGSTWDMKERILAGMKASAHERGDAATEQYWQQQHATYQQAHPSTVSPTAGPF